MAAVIQPNNTLELTPQVLEKLQGLQNQPQEQQQIQVNMIRPTPSKSADNKTNTQLVYPEKSTSLTLAERRKNNSNNIPASFKLYPTAVDAKVSFIPYSLKRCSMSLFFSLPPSFNHPFFLLPFPPLLTNLFHYIRFLINI